jgi:hypothetical protein
LNVVAADGRTITTPMVAPGSSATITFTLSTTGTYDYISDIHAPDLRGKLTVSDESATGATGADEETVFGTWIGSIRAMP